MGGGTYTGIEAISNGLQILREPRVQTGRRTMLYMAVSLSLTAGGLILCYLLAGVHRVPGRTLNAVLTEKLATEALGPGSLGGRLPPPDARRRGSAPLRRGPGRASSTGPASSRTWRSTPGSRTGSACSRTGS